MRALVPNTIDDTGCLEKVMEICDFFIMVHDCMYIYEGADGGSQSYFLLNFFDESYFLLNFGDLT